MFQSGPFISSYEVWGALSAANKFCDRFSCLYNLQSHTVCELKTKFGDSVVAGEELVGIVHLVTPS